MPGFVSHIVMARDVYDKLNHKNVNLDDMLTYSLGGDLSKYAKCRYDTHHKDMDKFIYEMADYIKNNNLLDDSHIIGVLYGHICHYVMDEMVHPLVRKNSNNKKEHTLTEIRYDNYLVNKRYHISKRKYLSKGILISKRNKEIDMMIDWVYLSIYDTDNVSRYYHFNLFLYRILRNVYVLFGDKLINFVIGVNKYVVDNELDDLYKVSVGKALAYIDKINKYLKN